MFYFSFALHLKVIFYFSLYKYIVWLEMSTRKYASGYEKLKKKKKEEKLIESQKWSMNKFVVSNKQNITQNLDENITIKQEIHQKELEDNEMIQLQDNNDVQFCNTTNLDNELQKNLEENENNNDMLNHIPSNEE